MITTVVIPSSRRCPKRKSPSPERETITGNLTSIRRPYGGLGTSSISITKSLQRPSWLQLPVLLIPGLMMPTFILLLSRHRLSQNTPNPAALLLLTDPTPLLWGLDGLYVGKETLASTALFPQPSGPLELCNLLLEHSTNLQVAKPKH